MTLVREICAWVGFVVISGTLLLALLITWLAFFLPSIQARRNRRRAIDEVIQESRFYLATRTQSHP